MNKTIKHKIKAKYFPLMSFLIVAIFVISGCTDDDNQIVATFTDLVMQDEFNKDGVINSTIWDYETGDGSDTQAGAGWGNNELQYYTDHPENIYVQNGVLIITARKEDFNGYNYTSGKLVTKKKFKQTYGRYEARIKVPEGSGLWPSFWLLGENYEASL